MKSFHSCALMLATGFLVAAAPPPVASQRGMVAADARLASEAGASVLELGGNAADAAVATALSLGVVHPHSSGIGGGGFVLYFDAKTKAVTVLDFRERAPACATADMFIRDGAVDPELTVRSGLAVGVPGEIAGLWTLHQRFGALSWAEVVEPAIDLADAFEVDHQLATTVERMETHMSSHPALAASLQNEDGSWIVRGQVHENPGLAATLRAVAEKGPDAFYKGKTARSFVNAVAKGGGCMTQRDLAQYEVRELEPLVGSYRGLTLYTMPPPSSGGVTMLETLAVLEGFDLQAMGHNSSAYLHHLAEALKFGFADRATYLGDPHFVDIPMDALLSPALAKERQGRIDAMGTLPIDSYGLSDPSGQIPDDGGTSHFSIMDADRNVVSLTTTINTSFGSLLVTEGTGIVLNNEMGDFTAQPGVANNYGLMGTAANAVAPGKTPLSSMSPTLVLRDGQPLMAVGASGGPRIITATLQTFLNVVDFEMDVSDALARARVHHQWLPERVLVEPEHSADVLEGLRKRTHEVKGTASIAAVQAVVVGEDGALHGASDPRKGGTPSGL